MKLPFENNRFLEIPGSWTRKKHIKEPYRDYMMRPPYDQERKTNRDIEVAPAFL